MRDSRYPWILGIGSSHNGGACLLRGEDLIVAIQEERLLRQKRASHQAGQNSLAIQYCLDAAGIKLTDLSAIGACVFSEINPTENVRLNPCLSGLCSETPTFVLTHHVGHAISAFATSGFTDSAILVVDGNGSPWTRLSIQEQTAVLRSRRKPCDLYAADTRETISIYLGSGNRVQPLEKHVASVRKTQKVGMRTFYSLGTLFEHVGQQIFGESLDGAGKVMGLAPFGQPTIPRDHFFEINGGEFDFKDIVPREFSHDDRWPLRVQEYQNLAASVQLALEDALLWLCHRARKLAANPRLCYAGGVALNSVANQRIANEGIFDSISIIPAADDSGVAVGAAYFALWQLVEGTNTRRITSDSWGKTYAEKSISESIIRCPGVRSVKSSDIVRDTVDLLVEGRIVGWFQGGSELGPRALGYRSILCDPRSEAMKDVLDKKIKFREPFRPYAPAVLLDEVSDWFITPPKQEDSPFMLRVMPFRPEKRALVPAVVHIDGTGRVQTLTLSSNGLMYDVVNRFREKTGVPILLNTSFNIAGEPIVETPDDALWCFLCTAIDACIVGSHLVEKKRGFSTILDFHPRLIALLISQEYPIRDGRIGGNNSKFDDCLQLYSSANRDLTELIRDYNRGFLRIVVETPWGRVAHLANRQILRVLKELDGKRTGWQVLEALLHGGTCFSIEYFERILRMLVRGRIIEFSEYPRSP